MEANQIEILHYHNQQAPNPNFELVVNVRFHRLTRRQFYRLRRLYSPCTGRRSPPRVHYNSSAPYYELLDFMSPKVQATWGHTFVPANGVYYQCYGFLLDVLFQRGRRRRVRFTLSAPDPRSAYEALQHTTTWVSDSDPTSSSGATRSRDSVVRLRPGDLILVYHDNSREYRPFSVWLDHVAMYVDEGLLLEKSGNGIGTPFRFVDYRTFRRSWGMQDVFQCQVRRRRRCNPFASFIDICKDLAGSRGSFVLPDIKALLDPSQRNDLCCYSYDRDTGVLSRTVVACPNDTLLFDEQRRAHIPPQLLL